MKRFVLFFAGCICIAGVLGGVADAAMGVQGEPPAGPAGVAAYGRAADPDDEMVPLPGGTAGQGIAFIRGATYPAWVPDAMRGLVPWWQGGKPGMFAFSTGRPALRVVSGGCGSRDGRNDQTLTEPRRPVLIVTLPMPASTRISTLN